MVSAPGGDTLGLTNGQSRKQRNSIEVTGGQSFQRNGLVFRSDRNSYFYPIKSTRLGEVSGWTQVALL